MKKETITPESPGFLHKIKEVIEYKDLFLALAYRDLMIKYVQTYLGLAWAVLQPLATIAVFSIVFGKVMQTDTHGIPYPLFITLGMSFWNYFSVVMQQSGSSIISSQNMVSKIYFPRLILPLSKAFVGLTDFLVGFVILVIMMVWYGLTPGWNILFYPLIFIWLVLVAVGAGIWLSTLTIKFRDFQYILPFLVQFGLYISPVGYSLSHMDELYKVFFYLNPLTGILELARWSVLGFEMPSNLILISLLVTFIMFFTSIWHFNRTESQIADLL